MSSFLQISCLAAAYVCVFVSQGHQDTVPVWCEGQRHLQGKGISMCLHLLLLAQACSETRASPERYHVCVAAIAFLCDGIIVCWWISGVLCVCVCVCAGCAQCH